MDQVIVAAKPPKTGPCGERTHGSRASRNLAWSRHKDEIHKFYMLDNNTLSATIKYFQQTYALNACPRSWKAKLKDWKFDKYLTGHKKLAIVSRAQKRKGKEGKETVFFHFGRRIDTVTSGNYRRRICGNAAEAISPVRQTLADISYSTPRLELADVDHKINDHTEQLPQKQDVDFIIESRPPIVENCRQISFTLAFEEVIDHSIIAATIPSNSKPESGYDQLVQSPFAYGAGLWKAMVAFDDEITHKKEVEKEKALLRYKASSAQRLIVDRNLKFLEDAYTNCQIRIKVNGLEAEGTTIQEPEILTWSVTRSPINVWCHGCLQIIGAYMRYACSSCLNGEDLVYYCPSCFMDPEVCCLDRGHQPYPDESLLGWNCETAIKRPINIYCKAKAVVSASKGSIFIAVRAATMPSIFVCNVSRKVVAVGITGTLLNWLWAR